MTLSKITLSKSIQIYKIWSDKELLRNIRTKDQENNHLVPLEQTINMEVINLNQANI